MAAEVGLVYDDRYLQHNPGAALLPGSGRPYPFVDHLLHPSNHLLVARVKHLLDLTGLARRFTRIDARPATDDDLLAYHTAAYLARVAALSDGAGGDTGDRAPIGPGGDAIARLAAGGVLAAVDAVMGGVVDRAFALVRPPGHHAMADHGMGYCVYNNVVVAAHHARRRWGLERVLVVDWDVHHGNGTQDAFYTDPHVLFISLHQDNLYPQGWGSVEQVGHGPGSGFTVNVPLPAGTGNHGYAAAFAQVVAPIARQFQPQFVLVSAGQDGSNADPEGRMCLTTDGYRAMTTALRAVADDCCDGRLALLQEGGYAEFYAPYCTLAILEALADARTGVEEPFPPERVAAMPQTLSLSLDAAAALEQVRRAQQRYWSDL